MGDIPGSITNFYRLKTIKAYKAPLVGTLCIARGVDLLPGTRTVTGDEVQYPEGKAKRGYRVEEVPRESGEKIPKTVTVIEHTHGFSMHKKELEAYARMGESALNGTAAGNSGRLVAESLDDVIFNGDKNAQAKGIFADASLTPYDVDSGKEWNTTSLAPDQNIVEAITELSGDGKYSGLPMKLCLGPAAYNNLLKRIPQTQATYMDFVAKLFPNGIKDINRVARLGDDKGLLHYFDEDIAERNVEQDIETYTNNPNPDKDNKIYWNVDTYQAIDVHKLDAFLPLTNLVDLTP
jgi:hypothetical protein